VYSNRFVLPEVFRFASFLGFHGTILPFFVSCKITLFVVHFDLDICFYFLLSSFFFPLRGKFFGYARVRNLSITQKETGVNNFSQPNSSKADFFGGFTPKNRLFFAFYQNSKNSHLKSSRKTVTL